MRLTMFGRQTDKHTYICIYKFALKMLFLLPGASPPGFQQGLLSLGLITGALNRALGPYAKWLLRVARFDFLHFSPPPSPLGKPILPSGEVVGSIFVVKMRETDELKGTWSNFSPWLRVYEHRAKTVWGLLQPLFGELGLNFGPLFFEIETFRQGSPRYVITNNRFYQKPVVFYT